MSFLPGRIRAQVNVCKRENWIDQLTSASPVAAKGFAIDVEIGFFTNTISNDDLELMDFSGFTAVTVEIHEDQFKTRPAVATVLATDFNAALTAENWIAQTAFHCKASFSETDMAFDLGANSEQKNFWIYIHGIDADGKRRPLGGTTMIVYETGASDITPGPNQGGNLIPGGAVYDGSGNYVVGVTLDKRYEWTKGANDTSVVNGAETVTATGTFTTQGTSITLKGTAGQAVTALLRYPLYFTGDETISIIDQKTRIAKAFDYFISDNKQWKLTIGVDDTGKFIAQVDPI